MSASLKWVFALSLIAAACWGAYSARRSQLLARLPVQCVTLGKQRNWIGLEAVARDWLAQAPAPGAWYWLGIALKEQRRFPEAADAFGAVPVNGPRGIDAAIERMELQFHVFEQPLKAMQLAERLLKDDPRLASPRRHRIYFYAMTLQRSQLLQEVSLAIKYGVDVPEHYVYLVWLEDLSFSDADVVTGKWAAANPDSELLQHVWLARRLRAARARTLTSAPTREDTQRYQELRAEIAPQLRGLDADPAALDMLLLLCVDDSDVEEAGKLLGRVPDSAVEDPIFWKYRGWYAASIGDLQQADDACRRSLELYPLGWQARNVYANVLRLSGETEAAGRQQKIAADGSDLVLAIRRLPHPRDVTPEQLRRMAQYATDCGAWEIANGLQRRLMTGLK